MKTSRFTNELCWFGASALSLVAFGSVVAGLDASTAYPPTLARDAFVLLSVSALVVMVILIVLASSIERKMDNRNR